MNNVTIMCRGGLSTQIAECDGGAILRKLEEAVATQDRIMTVTIVTKTASVLIVTSEFVFAVSEEIE